MIVQTVYFGGQDGILSNEISRNLALLERNFEDPYNTLKKVEPWDSIYRRGDWDGSPIVIEEFNLLFFTSAKVACTSFKMMLRRMMGHEDWAIQSRDRPDLPWKRPQGTGLANFYHSHPGLERMMKSVGFNGLKEEDYNKMLPWNPETNGLKYLYDYSLERATEIMTSPEWTRAIFVRDPKERFLSAYLDKVMQNPLYLRTKCCPDGSCVESARESLGNFLRIARRCDDAHWRPQSRRMEPWFWQYINFVGHMDSLRDDAEKLFRQVGAWEEYGSSGWGENEDESFIQAKAGGSGRAHATNARQKLKEYMWPELEVKLDNFYASDYLNPKLGLQKLEVFEAAPYA